ncbi:hypothetical protein C8046_13020 [Serinibacter arcticus]|uniref:Uncharacterized protein n=2 Tax=Serinibacter arcticus TaxID=1655435 RepID=A0A2U1ZWT9_9MICO|nr:hypothetical protein C8046_13020 [Serinibacter arcticus]
MDTTRWFSTGRRRPAPAVALLAAAALAVPALAACGQRLDLPTGAGAACGDPLPAADLTLEGLGEGEILLVESALGFEEVVVYRDGRVVVVGGDEAAWERSFEDDGEDGDADASAAAQPSSAQLSAAHLTAAHLTAAQPTPASAVVVPAMAWTPHPSSPLLLLGQLPECALAELDGLAGELREILDRTDGDLGFPQITDQSTSAFDYRGANALTASAYALHDDYEDGLTSDERTGRDLLRSMEDVVAWNLPDVVAATPETFETYPDGGFECAPLTGAAELTAMLEEFERTGESTARPVPPGFEPCD